VEVPERLRYGGKRLLPSGINLRSKTSRFTRRNLSILSNKNSTPACEHHRPIRSVKTSVCRAWRRDEKKERKKIPGKKLFILLPRHAFNEISSLGLLPYLYQKSRAKGLCISDSLLKKGGRGDAESRSHRKKVGVYMIRIAPYPEGMRREI